ncbi:MAG: photosynthetic complex putative assembly protein PuhB [Myxococcota bacterium]
MSDVQIEPVPGLPAYLPPGENILWQGRPQWRSMARRTFHVRAVGLYLALAVVARGFSLAWNGADLTASLWASLTVTPVAATGVGVLLLLAWAHSRTTLYTLTDRRIVLRYGVAFPMAVNVPFKIVGSASLKLYQDGTGEIPLNLTGTDKMSYLHLWPHARPWRFSRAEPMLRAVPHASDVAALVAEALQADQGRSPRTRRSPERAPVHAGGLAWAE